jgi:hypothetical protein
MQILKRNYVMSCEISGYHGGDYEECSVLGYKNSVRTLQDTLRLGYRAQHVNAVRFEVLTAVTEECRLLGCVAVWLL